MFFFLPLFPRNRESSLEAELCLCFASRTVVGHLEQRNPQRQACWLRELKIASSVGQAPLRYYAFQHSALCRRGEEEERRRGGGKGGLQDWERQPVISPSTFLWWLELRSLHTAEGPLSQPQSGLLDGWMGDTHAARSSFSSRPLRALKQEQVYEIKCLLFFSCGLVLVVCHMTSRAVVVVDRSSAPTDMKERLHYSQQTMASPVRWRRRRLLFRLSPALLHLQLDHLLGTGCVFLKTHYV